MRKGREKERRKKTEKARNSEGGARMRDSRGKRR